jgi:hypothetical protein
MIPMDIVKQRLMQELEKKTQRCCMKSLTSCSFSISGIPTSQLHLPLAGNPIFLKK